MALESYRSYRFSVSGRVQGVGFRQSAADVARAIGLDGWVRNLADGRVAGLARGEAGKLEQMRKWLEQGPPAAHVDAVEWDASEEQPAPGFAVRRDL